MATTSKPNFDKNFTPWIRNLIWGGYGLAVLWMSWKFLIARGIMELGLMVAACSAVFVLVNISQLFARIHGQSVEKKASNQLKKFLGSKLIFGTPIPGRGDIDIVYEDAGRKFNIEIKSFHDTKRITKQHIKQTMDAAIYMRSTPVIWLPNAKTVQSVKKDGIQIYGCDAKTLTRYLKAA